MVMSLSGTTGATFPDGTTQPSAIRTFVSSNLSIPTAASQLFSVAHGLGQIPRFIRLVGVCLVANNGYSVGDETEPTFNCADNGNIQFNPWADATNIGYSSGSGLIIARRTDLWAVNLINNTNWALKIYAHV